MRWLAIESGTTALNKAVYRGDAECVKILMEYGANPYKTNALGMNAFEICDECGPFPKVKDALLLLSSASAADYESSS